MERRRIRDSSPLPYAREEPHGVEGKKERKKWGEEEGGREEWINPRPERSERNPNRVVEGGSFFCEGNGDSRLRCFCVREVGLG